MIELQAAIRALEEIRAEDGTSVGATHVEQMLAAGVEGVAWMLLQNHLQLEENLVKLELLNRKISRLVREGE